MAETAEAFQEHISLGTAVQEFEQEWKGQRLGDKYAFKARTLDVVTGWPYRIGVKALLNTVKDFDNEALKMHRVGKSRLFNIEGPTELVDAVEAIVASARREGRDKEDKQLLKSDRHDRWWQRR